MARKSLSSQVIEELDRGRGLLRSVADSVDPIIGHLLGAVDESMSRIETMCLAARQSAVNTALADPAVDVPPVAAPDTAVPVRRRSTSHKAPRASKAVSK
jgi:hypothetical protein